MCEKMIFYDPTNNEHYTITENGLREIVDIWQDPKENERFLNDIAKEVGEKFKDEEDWLNGNVWRYILKRVGFNDDVINKYT